MTKLASVLIALLMMVAPAMALVATQTASAQVPPRTAGAITLTYYDYLPWYPSGGIDGTSVMGEPITVMANFTWGGTEGWVNATIQVCDVETGTCDLPFTMPLQKVGGMWKAVLDGPGLRDDFYYGSDVTFFVWAEDGAGSSVNKDGLINTVVYLLPPVGSVNLTSNVSATTLLPGQTLWVNGSAEYNNTDDISGSWQTGIPQFSPLGIDAGFASYSGKTLAEANFTVGLVATPEYGVHKVSVTVSNATTGVSDTDQYSVMVRPASPLTASFTALSVEPSHGFPGEAFWVNGTAAYNNSQPMALSPVSVSSDMLTASGKTDALGRFSFSGTLPVDYGAHPITVNVTNSTFAAWLSDPAYTVWLEDSDSVNVNAVTATFGAVSVVPQTLYPNNAYDVSGAVTYNTGLPAKNSAVNLTVALGLVQKGAYTTVTDASGAFAFHLNAPSAIGNHTLSLEFWNGTYQADAQRTTFLNVTPVPAGADKLAVVPAAAMMDTDEHLAVGIVALFDSGLQADVNWTVGLSTSSTGHFSLTPTGAAVASVQLVNGSASVYYSDTVAWTNATLTADYDHPTEPKSANATVLVRPIDTVPPVVVATVNCTGGFLPLAVRFDGSASTDDRGIVSVEWRVTNGTVPVTSSASAVLDFTFTAEGDYLAVFTATDARGNSANFTAHVVVERDTDGDDYADPEDAFPTDPTEWEDTDGDAHGDNSDAFPTNATEWDDTDLDGWGDNADEFPLDETQWADADGDGYGDNATGDLADAFPDDPTEWNDTDEDGVGDNSDAFPADDSEWLDTDGDTRGDNSDVFPTNSTEWADADGDGWGDNVDKFDADAAAHKDTDGDGHPDAWNEGKTAADSTSVPPLTLDHYPLDPLAWEAPEEEDNTGTIIIIAIIAVVVLAGIGAAAFLAFGKGK